MKNLNYIFWKGPIINRIVPKAELYCWQFRHGDLFLSQSVTADGKPMTSEEQAKKEAQKFAKENHLQYRDYVEGE